jgi:hypothetical protein
MHRRLAFTAYIASNSSILRHSPESTLQIQSINWNAEAMTVNCLTHVLMLLANALLARLSSSVNDGCMSDEDDDDMYDGLVDSQGDDDNELYWTALLKQSNLVTLSR